jgi:hypothetical protein
VEQKLRQYFSIWEPGQQAGPPKPSLFQSMLSLDAIEMNDHGTCGLGLDARSSLDASSLDGGMELDGMAPVMTPSGVSITPAERLEEA